MGLTPSVEAGDLIQSAWGNEIRDRTIQAFSSEAERTEQWPDAPVGARSILTDNPYVLWFCVAAGTWVSVDVQIGWRTLTTNGAAGFTVPFPRPFTQQPAVVVSVGGGSSTQLLTVGLIDAQVTPTQFGGVVRSVVDGSPWVNAGVRVYYVAGHGLT